MTLPFEEVRARRVLTPTSGFLGAQDDHPGYTHSFNPAIGCAYSRGFCGVFCYAREFAERLGGRGTWGARVLLKVNAAELLERELARAAARPLEHPHHVSRLRVFSASSTDPCAGPALELYRACLRIVAAHPVARWVIQTRSPRVVELEREIRALGERAVLSFTLESDGDRAWRLGPAGAPTIAARRRAFERIAGWGIRRHLAVSPCLPLEDVGAFASWIADTATDATVDTFLSGDGSGGRRTARTELPEILARADVDWRDEEPARALHAALRERMGDRAGWSVAGFARLAAS
jgi:DNA repair photolyase